MAVQKCTTVISAQISHTIIDGCNKLIGYSHRTPSQGRYKKKAYSMLITYSNNPFNPDVVGEAWLRPTIPKYE